MGYNPVSAHGHLKILLIGFHHLRQGDNSKYAMRMKIDLQLVAEMVAEVLHLHFRTSKDYTLFYVPIISNFQSQTYIGIGALKEF